MGFTACDARVVAVSLLGETLPQRWAHVTALAKRAIHLDQARDEGNVLETASWVHDIGYAPSIARTGFHPLDGARYLRAAGWPERIAGLVAFHSSAASEAEVFGVADDLAAFEDERTLTRDLLWYLDMSTGPDGEVVSFKDRMAEVRERYPAEHYVIRALDLGMPQRVAAVERATTWLSSAGLDHV